MQKFLLINNNPAVSKLVSVSFRQLGFELMEISNYDDLSLQRYPAIVVDSQMYDKSFIEDLSALSVLPSIIYLKKPDELSPDGVEYFIQKPFLVTDFITFMNDIIINSSKLQELNLTPRKNIFEVVQEESTTSYTQSTNGILKNEDIKEIKDIISDDIFNEGSKFIFDDVDTFKNYDELEKEARKSSYELVSIDDIDEDDMIYALVGSSSPKKSSSYEVVKGELKSAIEYSVATFAMQSKILQDALKNLKMNITITFEDK